MTENTNNNTPKRNRRTKAEMAAYYAEKAAQLQHELENGTPDTSTESGVLKSMRSRLRKTNTELKAARYTLNGSTPGPDGKGMVRSSIADKIAHTEARLASQIETRDRAELAQARLPLDIEQLEAAIEAAEAGGEACMPANLTPLANEQNKTDEEHEAAFIANGEDNPESGDLK